MPCGRAAVLVRAHDAHDAHKHALDEDRILADLKIPHALRGGDLADTLAAYASAQDVQIVLVVFPPEFRVHLYLSVGLAQNVVIIKGELVGIVGIVDEITERKRLEKEVERLTFHDSLTGLYNRNYLELHEKTYIEAAAYPISFIMVDCNHLKETNDQQGHKAGDLLLQQTAQVLSRALPEGSLAVRMGGDEFLLLCPGCSAAQAETLIREMQTRLADASDAQLPLSAAFGASTLDSAPADAQGYQEAYQRADNAMYENKRSAR